jgi:hypothetical protein
MPGPIPPDTAHSAYAQHRRAAQDIHDAVDVEARLSTRERVAVAVALIVTGIVFVAVVGYLVELVLYS